MKTRFKKHVAHYTLAMIGLGLSTLTHAADTPAVSGDHTYGWHWRMAREHHSLLT